MKRSSLYRFAGGVCAVLLIVALFFSSVLHVFAEGEESSASPSGSTITEDLPIPTPSIPAEASPSPISGPLPSPSPLAGKNSTNKATGRGRLASIAPYSNAAPITLGNPTVTTGLTDEELINTLLGEGVTVSNIKITGVRDQIGSFSDAEELLGFDNGLVLSTGYANEAFTGSSSDSNDMGGDGDDDLSDMSGYPSNDAIVLEFDVISPTDTIFFQYMFASIEWDQGEEYNDNFALFINGQNHAFLPTTNQQVSVQTILAYVGESSDSWPFDSKDIYVDTQDIANFSFPGRTTLLNCNVKVTPGASNHIKIVIADTTDAVYNSAVFLKGGSLGFEPDDDSPKFNPGGGSTPSSKTGEVGGSVDFEVNVDGTPTPSLQWQVSTDGGITWVDVPGATAPQLTINGITQDQDGNMYRVIAVNDHGTTISEPFTLQVATVPSPSPSVSPVPSPVPSAPATPSVPPTGDAEDVLVYALLLAVGAVLLAGVTTKYKQTNK